MRILTAANVHKNPNAGASGTVYHTNSALRLLGHEVDELWKDALPSRIRHGNTHQWLELPRLYRSALKNALSQYSYDALIVSQPHAFLAAKWFVQTRKEGVFINRSHGVESRVQPIVDAWMETYALNQKRGARKYLSQIMAHLLHRHWLHVVRYCDGVIVQSKEDEAYLVNELHADAQRVRVIAHGLDACFRGGCASRTGEDFNLLFLSQYSFFKGYVFLPQILEPLFESNPRVKLHWVCDPLDHEKAISLFDEKFRNRVVLHGALTQEQLVPLLDTQHLCLYVSMAEGGAKAPLEAMARGVPVVGFNNSGPRDYVDNEVNGFLVETGDTYALTQVIQRCMEDAPYREGLARHALDRAQAFSWERTAQETIDFIHFLKEAKIFPERI